MLKRIFRQSQNFRMGLVAMGGALIGYLTYELLYFLNPFQPRATISWTFAFIIGVARQHQLHRVITFKSEVPYRRSLVRAYVMYSGAGISGTMLNYFLTSHISMHHRQAWLACLILTSTISLVLLKRYVFAASPHSSSIGNT